MVTRTATSQTEKQQGKGRALAATMDKIQAGEAGGRAQEPQDGGFQWSGNDSEKPGQVGPVQTGFRQVQGAERDDGAQDESHRGYFLSSSMMTGSPL